MWVKTSRTARAQALDLMTGQKGWPRGGPKLRTRSTKRVQVVESTEYAGVAKLADAQDLKS